MPINFNEYRAVIRKLKQLAVSKKPVALRHLEQISSCFSDYFSSARNDLPRSNPFDFPPLITKIRDIERYLSAVYKNEL